MVHVWCIGLHCPISKVHSTALTKVLVQENSKMWRLAKCPVLTDAMTIGSRTLRRGTLSHLGVFRHGAQEHWGIELRHGALGDGASWGIQTWSIGTLGVERWMWLRRINPGSEFSIWASPICPVSGPTLLYNRARWCSIGRPPWCCTIGCPTLQLYNRAWWCTKGYPPWCCTRAQLWTIQRSRHNLAPPCIVSMSMHMAHCTMHSAQCIVQCQCTDQLHNAQGSISLENTEWECAHIAHLMEHSSSTCKTVSSTLRASLMGLYCQLVLSMNRPTAHSSSTCKTAHIESVTDGPVNGVTRTPWGAEIHEDTKG